MSLGFHIKNKRTSLKISQEYVAEQLGVSRQAVSKWETNQSEPTTANLIRLADLFECDIKELVSPEQYGEEQKDKNNQIKGSQKDIKMQMAAVFGRILMLINYLGYIGAYSNDYGLDDWFMRAWWGSLFLLGVVLTFIGSRDYFYRKKGSKQIIWFDLLFAFSFLLYEMLPFENNINTMITLFYNIAILSIINIKFFIPVWRK